MCLICKSRLKSAISSTSAIESESGEVTPAWWRRAFILLCSGLYQLLVWTEFSEYYLGQRQSCSNDHLLYIFLWCAGHFNALLISAWAHPLLSALCMHSSKQQHIGLTNMNGAKCVVWPSCGAGFPSGRSLLSWGHQCQSNESLLWQANVIQMCRVWGAVHLTHLVPTPNINNKNWYKRLKVSKTAHEEKRRDQ